MLERLRIAVLSVRDPVVTNRGYDVAAFLTWFCYAAWGLFTAFSDRTVFENLARFESLYPVLWGGAIGSAAFLAGTGAVATFLTRHENIPWRIRAKRTEMVMLCVMLGLLVVYPITIALTGDGNGNARPDILALSLSYFPFAVFRVLHLRSRIKQLYILQRKGEK